MEGRTLSPIPLCCGGKCNSYYSRSENSVQGDTRLSWDVEGFDTRFEDVAVMLMLFTWLKDVLSFQKAR